jgi:hypothetical protein
MEGKHTFKPFWKKAQGEDLNSSNSDTSEHPHLTEEDLKYCLEEVIRHDRDIFDFGERLKKFEREFKMYNTLDKLENALMFDKRLTELEAKLESFIKMSEIQDHHVIRQIDIIKRRLDINN